jgi:aspartate 1-decarboxylase
MQRHMLKSKIHRATVTACELHYAGSVTIDSGLMESADLLSGELVHVLDVDNGARFETYVIEGERGAGDMCLNGAAARLVQPGDRVIVVSYGVYAEDELDGHVPKVVHVDERNTIVRVDSDPSAIAFAELEG